MEPIDLPLQHVIRPPRVDISKPPLLLLLHGMGGHESDFYGIASTLDDRFYIASIRAPFAVSAGKYIWYNTEPFAGDNLANPAQIEYSRQCIIQFIREAVLVYKSDPAHVFLMGFSQGAVICLSVMLTEPELLAGVVSMSGQILPEIKSLMVPPDRFKGLPVMVVHGLQDELYPISFGRSTRDILSSLPVILNYQEYPMGHFMTQESLADVRVWLSNHLEAKRVRDVSNLPNYRTKVGHVHLKVRELDRSIAFYMRYLGMHLVERTGNAYAFLSNSQFHHEVALQNVGVNAPKAPLHGTGLYHVAFEVPDQVSFARAYQLLYSEGLKISTVDHIICWSIYFNDPDGNGLEIYLDTRDLPGRSHLWQGKDLPLEPGKILAALDYPDQNS